MDSKRAFRWQNWVKVFLGLVIALVGVFTQFNIVINQAPPEPKFVRVASDDLIKRDGMVSRATCRGFHKHRGEAKRHFLDTYGLPKGSEESGTVLGLIYPLRNADGFQTCDLRFDLDDKLSGVDMTLWSDE